MRLELRETVLTLRRPLSTAHGVIGRRRSIRVDLCVGDLKGHGEIAPLPGFGLETYDEALAALTGAGASWSPPAMIGARGAWLTAEQYLQAAIAGVPMTAHLSGSSVRERLAVQALVGDLDPEQAANTSAEAARVGHLAVKLKVGAAPADIDIARIRAVRKAMDPTVLLRLDANGGWDHVTALHVLSSVSNLDIDLVEEPTTELDRYPELRKSTGLRLAVDEHASSAQIIRQLLRIEAVQAAVLKPAVLGGIAETYAIAKAVQDAGGQVVISSFIDGEAGLRAARDLALAVDPDGVHGIGTAALFEETLAPDVVADRGYLNLASSG